MSSLGVPVTSASSFVSRVSVTFWAMVLVGIILFTGGCKEANSDKIADAQNCLDKYATQGGGDLSKCEAYVADLTSPAAHGIRCASGFIREGFGTAQSFIDAFTAIETVNASSVVDFLRLITFDSEGAGSAGLVNANYANAQSVYGSCASSLAKGATMIASFSFLTNVLFKYSCDIVFPLALPFPLNGNCNMNDDALAAAIAYGIFDSPGGAGTVSMKSDLGTIVVNTHTVSCSTGASNEKLCEFLETAINNAGGPGNKALVGEEFLSVLANPPS